jgi:hypothetical protein
MKIKRVKMYKKSMKVKMMMMMTIAMTKLTKI